MSNEQRILRFITYYAIQKKKQKSILKKEICRKCGFEGGTFDFRKDNKKYSEAEIDAIELIVKKHKNGDLENVEML